MVLWTLERQQMLKEKETQHSFAGLLNIYISGKWLWYMQALFINRVKQNRCLKSETPSTNGGHHIASLLGKTDVDVMQCGQQPCLMAHNP